MSEQNVIESLSQRVERLEKQCKIFEQCHLDNHKEMHQLVDTINAFQKQLHKALTEAANQIIPSILKQCNAVLEDAQSKITEIAAATKSALSPEKLAEAIANVTPEKIADALSRKVLVTRPAARGETLGVIAVRQATPAELRNPKQLH